MISSIRKNMKKEGKEANNIELSEEFVEKFLQILFDPSA
jgi:hypothetical protein